MLELSKSDFLVNIDNAESVQSPSKLIDYKIAGRPILNIKKGKIDEKIVDEFLDFNIWLEYVTSLPRYNEREELGLTLDRANNDGNYEKGNLRWVERTIQNENRRI
jgi:hypothetical protein